MIKELPNFVHRKKFENYYILQADEVISNKQFNENLKLFSKCLNGQQINFELLIPLEMEHLIQNKIVSIPNSSPVSLDTFYELHFSKNNNLIYYSDFNFFITDISKKWEIYCSNTYGISIIGLDEEILEFFHKYIILKDTSLLKARLDEIVVFRNENDKKIFLEKLYSNYKL